MLNTAVRDAKRWLDLQLPLGAVSVNLSAVQFRHPQLPEMVTRCLQQAGLPARRLELELTGGGPIGSIHSKFQGCHFSAAMPAKQLRALHAAAHRRALSPV